jgi:2-succinyl-6-hydroxy-2,4-cyclohexadiene-1-carboxylate synthase
LGAPSDWDEVRTHIDLPTVAIKVPHVANWNDTVNTIVAELPADCDLVGYSMGGRLAIGCALAAREKVRRLMVVSGNSGISDTSRAERKRHDQTTASELRKCSSEALKRAFLNDWYRQPVFVGLTESQIEKMVEKRLSLNENYMADLLTHLSISNQPDYRPLLRNSNIDGLFVAGDRDEKYVAIANESAQLSERIQCEIIPNCGHIIPFEQPKRLAESIRQFLPTSTRGN